jgi:hypothetical protein
MDDEGRGPVRRRRRRGATRAQGAPSPAAEPPPEVAAASPAKTRRRKAQPDGGERGLRDIVGAGHSQLGVSGALRARDLNRPTDDDLAAAERDVVVVRRNWKPDERG